MSLIELGANLDGSETDESNHDVVRRCGSTSWEWERQREFITLHRKWGDSAVMAPTIRCSMRVCCESYWGI